jgi:hypothetical protein
MIKSITIISAQDITFINIYIATLFSLNKDKNYFNYFNNNFKHIKIIDPVVIWNNPTRELPIAKIQPYISEFYKVLEDSKIEHDLYVYSNHPLVIDFFYGKDIKVISLDENGSTDVTSKILHLNENFTLSDIFAKGWEAPIKS